MNKQPQKILAFLFPTFGNILWMAAFFEVLIFGNRMMNADGDLGRHLTLGRYILDQGEIPLRDLFSHTMTGQPLTPHEWLSQVIFALADRIFGLEGVILLCALVIGTTFWIVLKRAQGESQTLITAVLVAFLAMINSMVHWLARPHIFTFLLLAMWMKALDQMRGGKLKRWWVLPVLMALWANLHGAFIAGFVTWFIYGVGVGWDAFWDRIPEGEELPHHFWRYYLLGGGTAFLVTLLNPSGIGLWKTSIGYIGNKYLVDFTQEYQAPNFHEVALWPFLIYIGLLVIVIGLSNKKTESGLLFNGAAWLVMGLYSGRNIPLFAIVATPLLAGGLNNMFINASYRANFMDRLMNIDARIQIIEKQLKGSLWPVLSIVVAVVGLVVGFRFDYHGRGYAFDPEVFPVKAVNWLDDNPQEGETFNYFTWGGYLLYRQWPERQVFIDGQTDFYGEEFTRQYVQVITLQAGWESVLDQYNVRWVILPPDEAAVRAIQSELGWKVIYEDETAVILRR